jgi:broad specificity phosphatase PhoE
LEKLFPAIDFSQVDPIFPDKRSPAGKRYFYTKPAILARGRSCIEHLYNRPEKWVIVVSHSGFLRVGMVGRFFTNADYRVFDFAETGEVSHGKGIPRLRQWESTFRGGLGASDTQSFELGSGLPEGNEGTGEM